MMSRLVSGYIVSKCSGQLSKVMRILYEAVKSESGISAGYELQYIRAVRH